MEVTRYDRNLSMNSHLYFNKLTYKLLHKITHSKSYIIDHCNNISSKFSKTLYFTKSESSRILFGIFNQKSRRSILQITRLLRAISQQIVFCAKHVNNSADRAIYCCYFFSVLCTQIHNALPHTSGKTRQIPGFTFLNG